MCIIIDWIQSVQNGIVVNLVGQFPVAGNGHEGHVKLDAIECEFEQQNCAESDLHQIGNMRILGGVTKENYL